MQTFGARRRATTSLITVAAVGALIAGCTSSGTVGGGKPTAPASGATGSAATPGASTAPTGSANATVDTYYKQQIKWGACTTPPAEAPDTDLTAFTCGTFDVPLDYAKPTGEVVKVAVVKWAAANPAKKVGSLLTNPGGPGASGVDFVEEAKKRFDGTLHASFDIIGFDPRGLGRSEPIKCLSDKAQDALDQVDSPKDPAARKAKGEKDAKDFAAACQANSGNLLPYVGSRNVAHDMDVLRAVLGDKKLNYLGISYGTYIGAMYADQFPKNVGHVVLDGAVDPNADKLEESVQQQIGFEKSLEAFAKDCVTVSASECPVSGDPHAAAVQMGHFIDGLREHPLTTRDAAKRKLDENLGWTGTILGLYGVDWWKDLRLGLSQAMKKSDGSVLLAMSDIYNGRDQSGHYSTEQAGLVAVRCADFAEPVPSAAAAQKAYNELKAGASILNSDLVPDDLVQPMCENWPVHSTQQPQVIKADGSDPILVVGTTDDPATPYQNAVNLAKGFANARLLTRVGEGHAAFGAGNVCIDAAMGAYLVSGTLPADGTRCTA
jgi:pimeloyl-ACP methyl ester carboxylesterase